MYYKPAEIQRMDLDLRREEFFSSHVPRGYPYFDVDGAMYYTNLPAHPSSDTALPLIQAVDSLRRAINETQDYSNRLTMCANQDIQCESQMMLWQTLYADWQRSVDFAASAWDWVRSAVNPSVLLFLNDTTEFIWATLPDGLAPLPIQLKYWRKIFVDRPDATGEICCYDAYLMGGFPPGTKIYYHDKVFQL